MKQAVGVKLRHGLNHRGPGQDENGGDVKNGKKDAKHSHDGIEWGYWRP